jgi:RNA polymerase sigma-70 factor (ECF subfamily)
MRLHPDGTETALAHSNTMSAAGHDKPDFAQVIEAYDRRLYNLMLRLTDDHHYAQDLAQEVLVIAWREYPKFRGDSDVFTWLYRIAINHHRRFLRKMKFKRWIGLAEVDNDGESMAAQDPETVERSEQRDTVSAAIAALPRDFRETVVLFYYEDKDCRRIAEILACSEGTVKSRLWRGRRMLAGKLKGYIRETEG